MVVCLFLTFKVGFLRVTEMVTKTGSTVIQAEWLFVWVFTLVSLMLHFYMCDIKLVKYIVAPINYGTVMSC